MYENEKNFLDINNRKRSRPNNKNCFRHSLMKLIGDSQTNRTYNIFNGHSKSGITNTNNDKNDMKCFKTFDKTNYNIYHKDKINNRDKKNNKDNNSNKCIIKNKRKIKRSKSANILNKKNKSRNNNYQNISDKIIEDFNNLNDEVEIFQNQCMKMKKESYNIENKIRTLLSEDRYTSNKMNILKQQIKNIKNSFTIGDLKNRKDKNVNYINKDFILKNIGQKNNNTSIKNNNISNNKKNTIIYELNIENNK